MVRIGKILHPTDFSDNAREALRYAIAFAVEYRAKLHLLNKRGGVEALAQLRDEELIRRTTRAADTRSSSNAAWRPVALLVPEGSTITAPLLKITCSSSPSFRIASRTCSSCGTCVPTMTRPEENGTPLRLSSSRNARGGGSASRTVSFVDGRYSTAPFSATTRSNNRISGQTCSRSSSSRPVTRSTRRPADRSFALHREKNAPVFEIELVDPVERRA